MGQSPSTSDQQTEAKMSSVPVVLSNLQDDILRHAATLREYTSLNYKQLQSDIETLNKQLGSDEFMDANGKKLVFSIKKGSDTSILWRGTIRIVCAKVESVSNRIVSHRALNLRQFLQIRRIILYQANDDAARVLTPSVIDKVDSLSQSGGEIDECCICMERTPEVILPCAHMYCLPCIEQWNVSNKTCPICRETLETTDESWVISEKPDSAEVAEELRQCLTSLADTDKSPE
uniref:RING finger protein 141 n=1 Tax=Strigamia maritima TaxID=126957 RepID=T1IQR9_STRMM